MIFNILSNPEEGPIIGRNVDSKFLTRVANFELKIK